MHSIDPGVGGEMLGIEEAKKKYKEYIRSINDFEKKLREERLEVKHKDVWELEGTYEIYSKKILVADFFLNVPYYQTFNTFIEQDRDSFRGDNINNLRQWKENLEAIRISLVNLHNKDYF